MVFESFLPIIFFNHNWDKYIERLKDPRFTNLPPNAINTFTTICIF